LLSLNSILFRRDIDLIGYESAANSIAIILGNLERKKYAS